jgi:hypothetical protein
LGEDCAKAIKKSLEVFTGCDEFDVIVMTGDYIVGEAG